MPRANAPRRACTFCWTLSPAWPPWSPDREATSSVTTASLPPTRATAASLYPTQPTLIKPHEASDPAKPRTPMTWRQRLRRVFAIDLSVGPRCGSPVKRLAVSTDPAVIGAIVKHIDNRGPRAPPGASTSPS